MSNMVPQLEGRNHAVWSLLEDAHKEIVANDSDEYEINEVWIVSGRVFYDGAPAATVGQPGTGVPDATYKTIAWETPSGEFTARAYVIDQMADDTDLWQYLVKIEELEEMTGLDFYPELPDAAEDELEAGEFEWMWE